MKTVKVKISASTYRAVSKAAEDEGDTVEDFLEDFIEGSYGKMAPDEVMEEVEENPKAALVRRSDQCRTLAHIPEKYRKEIEDLLNSTGKMERDERMMNALKYVVQQLMTTPGTGDRRAWAQQMLKNICDINGDPYTIETQAALDDLLRNSGYMDLFSTGRSNPAAPVVPDEDYFRFRGGDGNRNG